MEIVRSNKPGCGTGGAPRSRETVRKPIIDDCAPDGGTVLSPGPI